MVSAALCFFRIKSAFLTSCPFRADAYVHHVGEEAFGGHGGILYESFKNHSVYVDNPSSTELHTVAVDGFLFHTKFACREDWMKATCPRSPSVTAQLLAAWGVSDEPNAVLFRMGLLDSIYFCNQCNEQEQTYGLVGALNVARQTNILSAKHNSELNTRNIIFSFEGKTFDPTIFTDGSPQLFLFPHRYIIKKPELDPNTNERYFHNVYVVSWMLGFNRRLSSTPNMARPFFGQDYEVGTSTVSSSGTSSEASSPSLSPPTAMKTSQVWATGSAARLEQHSAFLHQRYAASINPDRVLHTLSYDTQDLGLLNESEDEVEGKAAPAIITRREVEGKAAPAIITRLEMNKKAE